MSAIPAGYKQTEVGVIPEDWIAEALGAHVQINSGESPSLFRFEGSGIPYFKVDQLNNDSKYLSATPYFFRKGKTVSQGSLVFPKRGASILLNKVRILASDSYMDTNLMSLTLDESLDNEYLYYTLTHIGLWKFADTTSIPQINNKHVKPLVVPIPRLSEQRAIAAALSDVDALLAKLDQFIAKKRDLKQATMQQLLSGLTRLPGFCGEWEVVKAGDVGRFRSGSGFPIKDQGEMSGEYPLFKVSDMNNTGNETFMETANNYISETMRKQLGATAFPAESIVFAKVGAAVFLERKKILTRPSCLDNNMAAFVMDRSRTHCPFIHYVLLNTKLGSLVSTTALPSLSGGVLAEIELPLPSLPEQTAIATVLSDIDAEIAALETRREKTRNLKQGMMQELLTGRIRLA